ncbi:pentatricopeptide repeat-containing protein [Acrasis kona]|uniref:Pentatricopeptide repeat-containing protein n=1 Tax=Acrasis kona TaxID=1008807 RepID=A0AAW2Z702_9EUKA
MLGHVRIIPRRISTIRVIVPKTNYINKLYSTSEQTSEYTQPTREPDNTSDQSAGEPSQDATQNKSQAQLGDQESYKQISELLRSRQVEKAHEIVSSLPIEKLSTNFYTKVIDGYAKNKDLDNAKIVYEQMKQKEFAPTLFAYNRLIELMCSLNKPDQAFSVQEDMVQAGITPSAYTIQELIDGFSRVGSITKAVEVFEKMPDHLLKEPTTASRVIGALIKGYQLNQLHDEAIEFLDSLPVSVQSRSGFQLWPQNQFYFNQKAVHRHNKPQVDKREKPEKKPEKKVEKKKMPIRIFDDAHEDDDYGGEFDSGDSENEEDGFFFDADDSSDEEKFNSVVPKDLDSVFQKPPDHPPKEPIPRFETFDENLFDDEIDDFQPGGAALRAPKEPKKIAKKRKLKSK